MANAQTTAETADLPTSQISKMLNICVTPGDVFDEVVATPAQLTTWLAPMLLVILSSFFLLRVTTTTDQTGAGIRDVVEAGQVAPTQAEALTQHWSRFSITISCVVVVTSTFWSATIIWGIGRFFLKVRFPFSKALSVVGLTGVILALGNLVTGLLVLACGDATMRPALSVFLPKIAQKNPITTAFGVFNVFHLWSIAVLAIGLAKLASVSLKEALFWVLGYWLVLRLGFILLV